MKVDEAVKEAMRTDSYIYRKSVQEKYSERKARIKPTNSYEACILHVFHREKPLGTSRCWNPTADDLLADDWEITKA